MSDENNSFDFSNIITFLGVAGILIGFISLYFYAVLNNWINEITRIGIGLLISLLLFLAGYLLNKKNEIWSYFVMGGSFVIAFLSVGIGVLNYDVLDPFLGFGILTIFVIAFGFLSLNFSSRILAYYTIVGGYIIPLVTNFLYNIDFMIFYILLLTAALLLISSKYNWADLRLTSFLLLIFTFLIPYFSNEMFYEHSVFLFSLIFLTLIFLLYNISSIIFASVNKEKINLADVFILNLNSILNIIMIYDILRNDYGFESFKFGLVLIGYFVFYVFEYILLNSFRDSELDASVKISLISSAFVTLSIGLYLIFKEFLTEDFLMIPFIVFWVVFSYLASLEKFSDKQETFKIVSYIFLILTAYWYVYILRFNAGLPHASLFLGILFTIPLSGYFLARNKIDYNINGLVFILGSYMFLQSLAKYLNFFVPSDLFYSMSFSIFWLAFTFIALIKLSKIGEAKVILLFFLMLTLIKIIFVDFFELKGLYRIIGFMSLGVIMVASGYFLKGHKLLEFNFSYIEHKKNDFASTSISSSDYAGFWLRFCALVVDFFFLLVVLFSIIITFAIIDLDIMTFSLVLLFLVIFQFGYFVLMESSSYQATLGKLAFGLKVVDMDGRKISVGRSLGRNVSKIISQSVFYIGFIMAGFTPKKQALHDLIAGCLVVKSKK